MNYISTRIANVFFMAALALSLSVAHNASADDEEALAKAPKVVQEAVKKLIGKNKLEGFDKEDEKSFEVNYKVGSTDYAAIISETGEILENEVEIDMSAVPAAVLEAAKKALPEGKIGEVAIVTAAGKMFYELDIVVGKDTHEIKISAKGKVIEDKIETPEAKDKADEKDEKDEKDAKDEKSEKSSKSVKKEKKDSEDKDDDEKDEKDEKSSKKGSNFLSAIIQ